MAQEMQVRYVSAYSFDAKWAGEFEIVMDQIRAPGYYRSNEKFSPKKWIFRWYYTEEGSIEIAGTDNRLGYNAKSKEYWIEPPENHESIKEEEATTSELEENKKNREQPFINNLLTSFNESIFDGDESKPLINRLMSDSLEDVNGFRAKKWTTTISTNETKMIIEEWMVDNLLLKDTFYSYYIGSDELGDKEIPSISSNDFIKDIDSTSSINNIDGDIVKAKLVVESDNAWVKSMEFEIRELYTIPFDASSFAIPEDYERVEEPNRSWSNQNESK
tara:strand:+ start:3093 stop:3917 length:825 start_codon:yes stop_codon:yes gene_type:complete